MTQTAPQPTEGLKDASLPPTKEKHRKKPIPLIIGLLLLVSGIGYGVWRWLQPPITEDILKFSGRIEGYETEIGVKQSGRIETISVREGVAVKKGQQLIQLDDSTVKELQDQLQGAQAQVSSAQSDEQQAVADVERVQGEIKQIDSQIEEAKLNLLQSQGDTQGRVKQAQANVAAAKAQLVQAQAQVKQAEAEVKLAKLNRDRYAKLVNDGAINQQQFDQAQTTYDTAVATVDAQKAAVNAAREQLSAAEGELTQAKTTGLNLIFVMLKSKHSTDNDNRVLLN